MMIRYTYLKAVLGLSEILFFILAYRVALVALSNQRLWTWVLRGEEKRKKRKGKGVGSWERKGSVCRLGVGRDRMVTDGRKHA